MNNCHQTVGAEAFGARDFDLSNLKVKSQSQTVSAGLENHVAGTNVAILIKSHCLKIFQSFYFVSIHELIIFFNI